MRKIYSLVLMAVALLVGTNVWATDVSTLQELKDAVAAGGDITLMADIDGGTNPTVTINPGKTVNLDLNGHRFHAIVDANGGLITNNGNLTVFDSGTNGTLENTKQNAGSFRRFITSSGTLWIKKGNVIAQSKMCINAEANSTLIIGTEGGSNDDVLIESKRLNNSTPTHYDENANSASAITTRQGSSLTIYCGTLKSNSHYTLFFDDQANVNIYNGIFTKGPEVTSWFGVNGGFVNSDLKVYGGTFPTDPTEYLSQDYYAQLEDGVYNIYRMPDPIVSTVNSLSDIKNQLTQASATQAVYMTLGANIVINEKVELPHASQLTIPAGLTLTIQDGGLFVNKGRTINNGTISTIDNGFFSNPASVEGTGNITISNFSVAINGDVVTYTISNGMQLQYLAYLVALEEYTDKTWNISLTSDITMPTEANFETIREISGTFDGQKHSINNFTAQSPLFAIFQGHMKDVTFNNATIVDGGAVLCGYIDHNTIFENVILNGTSSAVAGAVAGFIATAENISSAGRSYGMQNADDYLWFVNCVNNINATASGSIAGGFIGTISGAKGTIGFYNCENQGNVTSNAFAGALIGYGMADATIDVIAFTNTGTITGPSNASQWKVGGVNYVGYDDENYSTTYLNPSEYVAVWDETNSKYVAREVGDVVQPENPTTTDWATNTTWAEETQTGDPVVPTASDVVEMTSNVVINNGTDAEAKQVTIYNNKTLTVKEGGTLTIGDGGLDLTGGNIVIEPGAEVRINGAVVGGASEENIVISSDETGTSVFAVNPANPMVGVEAEIQLYTTARHQGGTYYYNYIGIPTSTAINSSTLTRTAVSGATEDLTMYLYGWNVQTGWQQGGWELFSQPFRGVALTSESTQGTIFTFKGTLVGNEDGQMNFNHMGFNFFANSYTAPINISTLLAGFSDDVRATIYIYDQSRNRISGVSKADFSGYFTPAFTVIPSMQAFFVFTEEQTAVTEEIDYLDAVWNNTASNAPLNAPTRLMDNGLFKRAIINVTSQNGASDQVNLVGEDRFSADFDNGYDAVKFMNSGLNIYAKTATHSLQNIFTDNLEGTFIGFAANETDNMYTLSFEGVAGEPMAIKDLMTGIITVMTEGNTYTFTQAEESTIDNRFQIVGINQMPTAIDNVEGGAVSADGIYSITGQYVGTVDMWNEIPSGIYIVNGVKLVK